MEGYTKIGRIRPNYTGTWNAETAYTVLEMVKNEAGTASYIAKQDVPAGTQLTDEAYWAMVLDAGDVIEAAEQAAADANKAAQEYSELDGKVEQLSEEVEQIANDQIPTEYVKQAVDNYVSENNGGFATADVVETAIRDLGITKKDNSSLENGIVTFVTDDGCKQDYTVFKPLFANHGVPFCTAVKTNSVGKDGYATIAELLEIQAGGNEILSHTVNHLHLSELSTEADVEAELKNSKDWLLNNGFACETLCFPYGFWGEREKRIARKHYRAARCSDYGVNGLNQSPIETYELKCIWLDSAVVLPNDPSGLNVNTLDYYKYYIDKAVAENAWLIIGSHSNDVEIAGLTEILSEVVAYAKANSNVMTFKQALDVRGNVLEIGSVSKANPQQSQFAVGYNGEVASNEIGFSLAGLNAYDGNSTIDDFKHNTITLNRVNTATAISSNLPEGLAGTLFTYKTATKEETETSLWGYNYQIYIVLGSGNQYKRVLQSNKTWGAWSRESGYSYADVEVGTDFNKGVSSYGVGITVNYLLGANASYSPSGTAGTLVTIKPRETTLALVRQIYYVYNSRDKYERYNIDGSTWSAWKNDTGITATNAVDGSTSITAFDMGVTYSPVNTATAAASGLPESMGGTLVTYKVHSNPAFNYQTYHVYGTAKMYKRSFGDSGTPTEWTKISVV